MATTRRMGTAVSPATGTRRKAPTARGATGSRGMTTVRSFPGAKTGQFRRYGGTTPPIRKPNK